VNHPHGSPGEVADLWFHAGRPCPGDVVLDIGAGIGTAARVFSQAVGTTGRVFAIEPHPRAFAQLEELIRNEALDNTRALRCAVSDRAGVSDLTDLDNFENNTLRRASEACRVVRVDTRTVDELLIELGVRRVDFLKMNIEGAERLAIGAMQNALAATRRVAIACHDFVAELKGDSWFRTKALVTGVLRSHGFHVVTRDDDARVYVRDYVYGHR